MSEPSTYIDPEQIMDRIRERVRLSGMADAAFDYEELRTLAEEIRARRRQLGEQLRAMEVLGLVGSLHKNTFEAYELAKWTGELPPPDKVKRLPPLNLLYRLGRKFMLKTQQAFNRAVLAMFRGVFQNLLQIERFQLQLLEESRRFAQLEERLAALERRGHESANGEMRDV